MAAKKFQVSADGGTTYFTFPGDTAALETIGTNIKDTVFGQFWESGQTGLEQWTMTANGFYKGFAGYVAVLKKSGTSTPTTNEATTFLSGKSYQITNVAHQILDPAVAVVVNDNAVNQTANVLSIDYMFGIVTFKPTYTVLTPVTVNANYLPTTAVAKGQGFTLTQTATIIKTTDFPTAQGNGGFETCIPGLNTVALEITGVYAISNAWLTSLTGRAAFVIEITPDGLNASTCRGLYKTMSEGQAGKVGELELETIKFILSVPDPSVLPLFGNPFSWRFTAGSTLSIAIQNTIQAWQQQLVYNWNYLYDGVNGRTGQGVVTDVSLKGGLDVMNEFTIKVAGSGAIAAVGTG